MQRQDFRWPKYGFDLIITVVAGVGVWEVFQQEDALTGARIPLWLAALGVALVVLALLARHRFPFGAPAMVWALGGAFSFVEARLVAAPFSVYAAGIAAAFLLGNLPDPARARAGLAFVVLGAVVVVYNDPGRVAEDFIFIPVTFSVAWVAGFALRSRTVQAEAAEQRAEFAERERESAARLAVAEERARITRELHDIVAHAVSVMVLQVGAVRHQLPHSMAENRGALRSVEETGRAALTEMRRLLGALHDDGQDVSLSPQPGLDELGALVEKVRLAGLPVRVNVEGDPVPLPRAIDLSAYRIVQEGLTNSLKHAGAGRVEVTVRYDAEAVWLEVRDDGVGTGRTDGLGRGLTGIRERVKIYGGEMTAGLTPDGGFLLSAQLPFRGHLA